MNREIDCLLICLGMDLLRFLRCIGWYLFIFEFFESSLSIFGGEVFVLYVSNIL